MGRCEPTLELTSPTPNSWETAAASMDFEEASRLRDRFSLLRGQPDAAVNVYSTPRA